MKAMRQRIADVAVGSFTEVPTAIVMSASSLIAATQCAAVAHPVSQLARNAAAVAAGPVPPNQEKSLADTTVKIIGEASFARFPPPSLRHESP
jgi:hypothetical protein